MPVSKADCFLIEPAPGLLHILRLLALPDKFDEEIECEWIA